MEHRTWNIKTISFSLITFVLLVALDHVSKYITRFYGGFYVCNPNIAFGIEIPTVLFWIFWGIIVGAIFWLLYQELRRHSMSKGTSDVQSYSKHISKGTSNVQSIALMLILAGALSNIIDRIALGCVVDFIDFRIWPVFNLADTFIVLGAVILLAKWRKMW